MNDYIVATGIVTLTVQADSAQSAIESLKAQFQAASEDEFFHAERWGFGYSLVEAHLEGRLNYLVFDGARTEILCGELNGEFQNLADRELLDLFDYQTPEALRMAHLQKLHRWPLRKPNS